MDERTESLTESNLLDAARAQRQGLRAAVLDLESAAAAPDRGAAWAARLSERVQALDTAFRYHVETTESDAGLFAEILDRAPRLAHRVDALRDDHRVISASIGGLAAELATGSDDDGRVAARREAALDVIHRVSRHRHQGADLVYEAYNVDIEAAD